MKPEKLRKKVEEINDILEDIFGIPEQRKDVNPLDSLIETILSQNTNDVNRNKAYSTLRERFPSWDDLLEADVKDIADAIRVGGLANKKSIRIKEALLWIKNNYGELNIDFICDMEPEDAIETFTKLKGVGLKTMKVVLAFACGKDVFPVDTHILRISKRLDLVADNASADKAHEVMGQLFPEGKAYSLHINMIRFGRNICHARKPECKSCPLIDYCIAWSAFIDAKPENT
jgi:endonuclease-3